MPAVVTDLVQAASVSEDVGGVTAVRVFQVSGLTGAAHSRLANARNASGVPQRGDSHPALPDLRADTIDVSPQDLTKARVTVTYRTLNGLDVVGAEPVVEVGTTLTTITTSRDVDGDQVIMRQPVEEFDGSGNLTGVRTETQVASFAKQVPATVVTYRRKELEPPIQKAQAYVGLAGDIGPGLREGPGGPPWLCTRIDGATNDGGRTWDVSYEFQYTPRGWNAELEPIDPATGQPYINGTLVRVPIYRKANFLSALNLPRVDWPLINRTNA